MATLNYMMLSLAFLCSTILFAFLALGLFLSKMKQKKIILSAINNIQNIIKERLECNENRLKNSTGALLTSELEHKISQLILLEKECQNRLLLAFLDYHPTAVTLLPDMQAKITNAYMDYIESILAKTTVAQPSEGAGDEDTLFQYEALIEQLRYEKHDYADKYKSSHALLNQIYQKYKEVIGLNGGKSLDSMTISDIAILFHVDL